MISRKSPLKRGAPLKRNSRLSPVSDRRRSELAEYRKRRIVYLAKHTVCEVWCAENGWEWVQSPEGCGPWYRRLGDATGSAVNDNLLFLNYGAPHSEEIHHKNKRRGAMLIDESFWLAVCRDNHERIERNLSWARARGFSLNF